MELYVYSSEMELQGIVEKIASLIWTRRYWSCGEFKLLVPFTEEHSRMLVKNNIIMKRGDDEAAQIRYVHITKNSQGLEEIEVQGKFLIAWIGKRIIKKQIITNDTTQNILYRIVRENVTNPADTARKIPDVSIATDDEDTESGVIDYTSEQYTNAQLAAETAAKAAKLGIRMRTDARTGAHVFSVYEGRDLTGMRLVSFHRNSITSLNRNTQTAWKTLKQRRLSAVKRKKALPARLPKWADRQQVWRVKRYS